MLYVHRTSPYCLLLIKCFSQVNLGWKLGLVIRKLAPPSLLDSYTVERLPVVAEMLNLSTELHSLAFPRMESSSLGRENVGKPEDVMFRPSWLFQLGVNYRWSPLVLDEREVRDQSSSSETAAMNPYGRGEKQVHAGDRAPDATYIMDGPTTITLFDLFSVQKHTVLVFPGKDDPKEIRHDLEAMNEFRTSGLVGLFLIVGSAGTEYEKLSASCEKILVDLEGHTMSGYNTAADVKIFVAIRPDGFIGAYTLDVEGIKRYFSRIFL